MVLDRQHILYQWGKCGGDAPVNCLPIAPSASKAFGWPGLEVAVEDVVKGLEEAGESLLAGVLVLLAMPPLPGVGISSYGGVVEVAE